jgi:hypothetical protein
VHRCPFETVTIPHVEHLCFTLVEHFLFDIFIPLLIHNISLNDIACLIVFYNAVLSVEFQQDLFVIRLPHWAHVISGSSLQISLVALQLEQIASTGNGADFTEHAGLSSSCFLLTGFSPSILPQAFHPLN